jgi:hypothetical protein
MPFNLETQGQDSDQDSVDVNFDESAEETTDDNGEPLSSPQEALDLISEYWAAEPDGDKLWQDLKARETAYFEAYQRRGLLTMQRLVYGSYFGLTGSSGQSSRWQTQSLSFAGEDGELIEFSANEFRSFCDQIFAMMTKNRPAFQALAVNSDARTLSQVEASDTIVQYYYEQIFGEKKEKELVKIEGLYGKAYIHLDWDEDGGPEIEVNEPIQTPQGPVPNKKKVHAGEFIVSRHYPWEVICEPFRSEYDGHLWRMVVGVKRSKWEMMARYPMYAAQIKKSETCDNAYEYMFPGADPLAMVSEDMCSIRVFYHAKTAAMPQGRKALFVNGILVDDSELEVEEIPVLPMVSCELHGTGFGISDLWNIIPLDQMENQVLSDMATNVEAFGRPPIALVEGTDVDLDALANGQKVLFIPPNTQTPEAVKFPQIPEVSFKLLEMLRQLRQSISGLNAIARGDTSTNVTSGAHAALYSQIAVEAQSPRQAELDLMRERIANMLLTFLKKYAKYPQMVAIAGQDERAYMDSFEKEDWEGIHRIHMKTANPAMRTREGRLQIAELLRDWPGQPVKDPGTIIDLITTGQIKPMYNLKRVTDIHIRAENEALLEGPQVLQEPGEPDPMTGQPAMNDYVDGVRVLITENVQEHLFGHLEVVYSPAAQKNPAVKQAALTHIQEHIRIARAGDPYLAQVLGIPGPEQSMQQQQPGAGANGSGPTQKQSTDAQKTLTAPDEKDDSKSSLPTPAKSPVAAPLG